MSNIVVTDTAQTQRSTFPPLRLTECRAALQALREFQQRYREAQGYCFSDLIQHEIEVGIHRAVVAQVGEQGEYATPAAMEEVACLVDRLAKCLFCPLSTVSMEERVLLKEPVIDPTAKRALYVFERASLEHFFALQEGDYRNTEGSVIEAIPTDLPSSPMTQDLVYWIRTYFSQMCSNAETPRSESVLAYRINLRRNKDQIRVICHVVTLKKNQERMEKAQAEQKKEEAKMDALQKMAEEIAQQGVQEVEKRIGESQAQDEKRYAQYEEANAKRDERLSGVEARVAQQEKDMQELDQARSASLQQFGEVQVMLVHEEGRRQRLEHQCQVVQRDLDDAHTNIEKAKWAFDFMVLYMQNQLEQAHRQEASLNARANDLESKAASLERSNVQLRAELDDSGCCVQ